MNSYRAKPLSRNNIKQFVRQIKSFTGYENELYFPVVEFMENVLPQIIPDFNYEILPVIELGNSHGETNPNQSLIKIREDVYERAVAGVGRDRLTVAHEIGHLLLHDGDFVSLCRLEPNQTLKPYENPEWQADAFGGELLASSYLIRGMTVDEVVEKCVVSESAAYIQLKNS